VGFDKMLLRLVVVAAVVLSLPRWVPAAELQALKLNPPDKKRGLPVMEALSVKASAVEWSDRELSLQDLSDLLWAGQRHQPAGNQEEHRLIGAPAGTISSRNGRIDPMTRKSRSFWVTTVAPAARAESGRDGTPPLCLREGRG
jgi:hypothetical protein